MTMIFPAIISPQELHSAIASGMQMTVLDASYHTPPPGEPSPHDAYLKHRIKNAQFFDIQTLSDPASALPNMLPHSRAFEEGARGLGVSNHAPVIIYGQASMAMGPARAWWMFKVFGHAEVSVLDGGLQTWQAAGYDLTEGPPSLAAPGDFTALYHPARVATLQDVQEAQKLPACLILDARPPARFNGNTPEPRPGLQSGHIPGSINLPALLLLDSVTGRIKPADSIRELLLRAGYNESKPVIATCGSGITACMIALCLEYAGYPPCAVYDGSWSEWGQQTLNLPVAINN
jgi:thiosulfate/3-mercaptopyruvate sulfurtransferase